jgi:hypothetical protein
MFSALVPDDSDTEEGEKEGEEGKEKEKEEGEETEEAAILPPAPAIEVRYLPVQVTKLKFVRGNEKFSHKNSWSVLL